MKALKYIVCTISDIKYIDVHGLETIYENWEKIKLIYNIRKHVKKDRVDIFKGNMMI